MTWNSGACVEPPDQPDDQADTLLWLILDYGEATFEHGRAQARYEIERARTASADDTAVTAAGRRALVRYAQVRSALAAAVPLLTGQEPGA